MLMGNYYLYIFIGDFVILSMSEDVDVVMNSQTPDSEKHELVMRIDQMSTSRSYVFISNSTHYDYIVKYKSRNSIL